MVNHYGCLEKVTFGMRAVKTFFLSMTFNSFMVNLPFIPFSKRGTFGNIVLLKHRKNTHKHSGQKVLSSKQGYKPFISNTFISNISLINGLISG